MEERPFEFVGVKFVLEVDVQGDDAAVGVVWVELVVYRGLIRGWGGRSGGWVGGGVGRDVGLRGLGGGGVAIVRGVAVRLGCAGGEDGGSRRLFARIGGFDGPLDVAVGCGCIGGVEERV